ncbi:hypothetical protein Godav_006156, partial [Gossypium davidsonii]|nr:hypothetical protein [Gossypium davidsonii]
MLWREFSISYMRIKKRLWSWFRECFGVWLQG